MCRHFPGSQVIKNSPSNAGDAGSVPGQGAKIPHALWQKKNKTQDKQYCKKIQYPLKMVHLKKVFFKKKNYTC